MAAAKRPFYWKKMQSKIHIGTSGWSYKHWHGTFYPQGTKQKDEFAYYARKFDSVEINNTFYRLPNETVFEGWEQHSPPNFLFILKASRYITHMKKLHDPDESLNRFLYHAAFLKKKLGPVLFQLPPFMKANTALLSEFLEALPAANRYVFEFRNPDWQRQDIYALLRQHNCCCCIYELAGQLTPMIRTADFMYVRLHGPGDKYRGNYDEKTLRMWADRCRKWAVEGDVFVYFDNDEKGFAAFNALRLQEMVNE